MMSKPTRFLTNAMKTSLRNSIITLITVAIVSIGNAATTFTLNPFSTFGTRGDGSIQPVADPFVSDSIGLSPYTGFEVRISAPGATNWYAPGEATYDTNRPTGSTNGFNMRGLTYDPVSGNVILVDTHSGSGGNGAASPGGSGGITKY